MAIYSKAELQALGFAHVGEHVKISTKASFYGVSNIRLGNHVRIDDFCVLSASSAGIDIGNYIHIGVQTSLIGAGNITLADFCNISGKVSIYSSNDDYSGEYMTNPMVDEAYTHVTSEAVTIGKHSIIGCGSVILPGVDIGEGVSVGALSLVNRSLEPWYIFAGQPVRKIKVRSKALLKLEQQFINKQALQD